MHIRLGWKILEAYFDKELLAYLKSFNDINPGLQPQSESPFSSLPRNQDRAKNLSRELFNLFFHFISGEKVP